MKAILDICTATGLIVGISIGATIAKADHDCPAAGPLDRYVTTKLRSEIPGDGVPDAAGHVAGKVRIYYRLLSEFSASKPTVLMIPGGPGGDASLIDIAKGTDLEARFNVVSFDHRGLGCTHILSSEYPILETGLLGMARAADDLDAIRKDLVGADGKWFVYGLSYGTMLGQAYITKYPAFVSGAILDSAFQKSEAIDIGRRQYIPLFIRNDPQVSAMYDTFSARYPDLITGALRAIRVMTYNFWGRTHSIPDFFRRILNASTREDAEKILGQYPDLEAPLMGMMRQILCEEIWDYSADPVANQYYWKPLANDCGPFAKHRHAMNFDEALRKLSIPVMIWGGKFDPVTPLQSMREMHALIPGSLLWENPEAGHGLIFEAKTCAIELATRFFAGARNNELNAIASRADCRKVEARDQDSRLEYRKYSGPGDYIL